MNNAKDMVEAFEQYYSTKASAKRYSAKMANTIVDSYAWLGDRYKTALYEEVIREFVPTIARPLPDMAALAAAERQLPAPATFAQAHHENRADLERVDKSIRTMVNEKAKVEGELNHAERERIRAKVRRGDASKWEIRWITVIDEFNNDWARATRVLGDVEERV